jgi:DNA polymerase-3 subunit delta
VLIRPDRLADHLARQPLARAYLLFGDEPWQALDCAQAVRGAATAAGVVERLVFDVASGVDWQAVRLEAGSLSLFASRRLLEIRFGSRKPDRAAAEALQALIGDDGGDDVWLLATGPLDRRDQASGWFAGVDRAGVVVPCRPLDAAAFRRWLGLRAAALGKRLGEDAVELLALRAEGNLLAAAQELDKLALIVDGEDVTADHVLVAVADSARYDVFKLVDAMLEGDPARAVRMLRGLREEGTEAVVVSWAVNREVRTLARAAAATAGGASVDSALASQGVWQSRIRLVRRALERLTRAELMASSRASARADAAAKGLGDGEPWGVLETLVLSLAGGRPAAAVLPHGGRARP